MYGGLEPIEKKKNVNSRVNIVPTHGWLGRMIQKRLLSFTIGHWTKTWKRRKDKETFRISLERSFCRSKGVPPFQSLKGFLVFLLSPTPVLPLTQDLLPVSSLGLGIWPGKWPSPQEISHLPWMQKALEGLKRSCWSEPPTGLHWVLGSGF